MKTKLITALLFTAICSSLFAQKDMVDYRGFVQMTEELQDFRQSRLIDLDTFNSLAKEEGTIILDTRSKQAYHQSHIEGAIHLNFSDFTEDKLAQVIPDKKTRILIYCNNNIMSDLVAFRSKMAPLALNIPTFINLHGYGYENIYELQGYYKHDDARISLVGSRMAGEQNIRFQEGLLKSPSSQIATP